MATTTTATGIADRASVNEAQYLKMLNDGGCCSTSNCWWCTHTFDTLPVCAPTTYDPKRDIFKVHGTFCSFECAKAYTVDRKSAYIDTSMITLLNKRLTGQLTRVYSAPPRQALQRFGGEMTIEAFRTARSTNHLHTIAHTQNLRYQRDGEAMKVHEPKAASQPPEDPSRSKPSGAEAISSKAKEPTRNPVAHRNAPVMLNDCKRETATTPSPPAVSNLESWMGLVIR